MHSTRFKYQLWFQNVIIILEITHPTGLEGGSFQSTLQACWSWQLLGLPNSWEVSQSVKGLSEGNLHSRGWVAMPRGKKTKVNVQWWAVRSTPKLKGLSGHHHGKGESCRHALGPTQPLLLGLTTLGASQWDHCSVFHPQTGSCRPWCYTVRMHPKGSTLHGAVHWVNLGKSLMILCHSDKKGNVQYNGASITAGKN